MIFIETGPSVETEPVNANSPVFGFGTTFIAKLLSVTISTEVGSVNETDFNVITAHGSMLVTWQVTMSLSTKVLLVNVEEVAPGIGVPLTNHW